MSKFFFAFLILLFITVGGVSANDAAEGAITHKMTNLVLQIGIILFAAKLGGQLFKKLKMPSVLGELIAGIIIGPYLLGGIPLPGIPHGIFPHLSTALAVTPELYGIATIASIILLFITGLETDITLFVRFSIAGSVVGIGGVIFSFGLGAGLGAVLLKIPFLDPRALFLGILSTATSVGITARILSEHNKMDSPEGVTILAAAVIDDVLGIILLAIVLGIVSVAQAGVGDVDWSSIGLIALKAVGVWLGFTVVGLLFSKKIGSFLKSFKSISAFSILSLGLALLLAGIFEKAGLAMIIGAYVMGLSLSKTDISIVIQERLHILYEFFVPIFFTVMGMLVNVQEIMSPTVLRIGLIYSVIAILAKMVGCGIPALFLNFNGTGAMRIGAGMVPRGEVALIIAGIGLTAGILDEKLFGIAILMTLSTTIVAPPVLSSFLSKDKRGTRKEVKSSATVSIPFEFPSIELTELLITKTIDAFKREGFFIHMLEVDYRIFQFRKDDINISLNVRGSNIDFEASIEDIGFVKTLVYESLLEIHETVEKIKNISKPETMRKEIAEEATHQQMNFAEVLDVRSISHSLAGNSKEEIIEELVDLAGNSAGFSRKEVLEAVFAREKTMSTGMQYGVALPHGKTDCVDKMLVAVGIKKEGIDFESLDGLPCKIFFLVVSPSSTSGPHIQFLSSIAAVLKNETARDFLIHASSEKQIFEYLCNLKQSQ